MCVGYNVKEKGGIVCLFREDIRANSNFAQASGMAQTKLQRTSLKQRRTWKEWVTLHLVQTPPSLGALETKTPVDTLRTAPPEQRMTTQSGAEDSLGVVTPG